MLTTPKGLLFDYGRTLVGEVSVDLRAGHEWLLSRASYRPAHVTLAHVLDRAARVSKEAAAPYCDHLGGVRTPGSGRTT